MLHGPILNGIGALFILFAIFFFILRYTDLTENEAKVAKTVRNYLALATIIGFGWSAFTMLSVDATPRSTIDRSMVNDRANTLDRDSHN